MKYLSKQQSSIPTLTGEDGNEALIDAQTADMLNEFFSMIALTVRRSVDWSESDFKLPAYLPTVPGFPGLSRNLPICPGVQILPSIVPDFQVVKVDCHDSTHTCAYTNNWCVFYLENY